LGVAGKAGTFVFSARHFSGPYSPTDGPVADNDRLGVLYAGKLLEEQPGEYGFMGFRGIDDRYFLGELTDPLPVQQEANGRFIVLTH
jgi:hypothetical protein